MRKLSLLVALLAAAAAAQSGGSSITTRVSSLLSSGVTGGTQGLYLKQVGGGVVANKQETVAFDPGTAADIVATLLAVQQSESAAIRLDTPVTHYDNIPSGCPNPPFPNGTESITVALRELMWRSDNARALAVRQFFGLSKLNDFAASLGMKSTTLPASPGCQNTTAGQTTLADATALLEGVQNGTLVANKATFNGFLSGKPQTAVEGSDTTRVWSADIPALIRQESPAGTTAAQQTSYQNLMDVGYTTGSALKCQDSACTSVLESLAIVGWARVPYCTPSGNASHDFVFGEFISNAADTAWFRGKTTAAEAAFAAARSELLREQIRAGLAACYGASPVMLDPAPGSILPGRTVTFTWSAGTGWDGYRLDLGSASGAADYGSVPTTAPQAILTNLPCDGRPLYVRLWSHSGTYVNPIDYQYTTCKNGGPQITSPPPGANLFAASIPFTWTAVSGADSYRLDIGTRPAGTDIASITVAGTSTTVGNIPTDGRLLYARITAHTASGFQTPNDYAYNNFFAMTPAVSTALNAVLLTPALSAGTLTVINGVNFGANPTVTVANVRALVLGTPTATQITVVIPAGLGVGATALAVTSGGLTSAPFPITLSAASPALYPNILDNSGAVVSRPVRPGDQLSLQATGIGPLTTAGTSAIGMTLWIGTAPSRLSATVSSITALPSSPGVYQINFIVPVGAASGNQSVTLQIGSTSSNSIPLTIVGPAVNSVLNAASFAVGGKVAPGSIVSLFGASLADRDALGVFPTASLPGGGAITVNGVSAPLFDVVQSVGQVNLLVPFETPTTGNVSVVVINSAGTSAAYSLAMAPAAPGIFRLTDPSNSKRANAAALVANTAWRVMPLSMAAALGIPADCAANKVDVAAICGQPAAPGDAIQIYATGLGRATPNGAPFGNTLHTGDVAPANGKPLYQTVETPRVTIGGVDAQVVFSGIAPGFAGLYQVNVVIPGGAPAGDDVPVIVSIGGASDQATIAIRSK